MPSKNKEVLRRNYKKHYERNKIKILEKRKCRDKVERMRFRLKMRVPIPKEVK